MTYLLESSSFHNPILKLTDKSNQEKVNEITTPFKLTKDQLNEIKKKFLHEINLGLSDPSKAGSKECSLHMINTYIVTLPNGQEEGDFLSLDLGSTNFRVCLSTLNPNQPDQFNVKYYDIPNEMRWGTSETLFNHIVECISDFMEDYPRLKSKTTLLGFTFSYPMKQEAIDVGKLVTWTKSYDIKDAIGQNAAALLQKAIDQKGINIRVAAILNDSSGTLVKGIYLDQDCSIGVIMGSGFNACYLEKVERIPSLKQKDIGSDRVLINLECGGFGDNGCVDFAKTLIDIQVDQESLFKGSFSYEKMFSGVFVGDLARRLMLEITSKGLMFKGKISEQLRSKDSFTAEHISNIEGEEDCAKTKEIIIKNLGYNDFSDDDVAVVKYICAILSVRTALLIGILLSTLIERIDKPLTKIAIDGSLYKHHPKVPKLMTDFIAELTLGRKFEHFLAEDGSGKGAGLVVAALAREKRLIKGSL